MDTLIVKDVYLRVTDNTTGRVSVRHHRAWDVDRFIEAQRKAHRDEGAKEGNPERFAVSLASAEAYRAANWSVRS